MKSYTDLEQSKKLSEFLPLESADMDYIPVVNIDGEYSINVNEWNNDHVIEEGWIPAWSLAALLGVIPYNVTFNKAVYRFKLVKFSNHWECYHENFGSVSTNIFKADNPVDACVAMIEKLQELNVL